MKASRLITITATFCLLAIAPTAMAKDKKKEKSFFCKVPVVNKTILCGDYRENQIKKNAPVIIFKKK